MGITTAEAAAAVHRSAIRQEYFELSVAIRWPEASMGEVLMSEPFHTWINVKIYAVENTELRTSCPTMTGVMSDKL
jgi:hypothetical protein